MVLKGSCCGCISANLKPLVFVVTNNRIFVGMDVSSYAAKPEAYDALSAYQIAKFFNEHGLRKEEIDNFAANLLGGPVSPTLNQGSTSYTVSGDEVAQVVQFRSSQLPMNKIEVAGQLYGDFVPECKSQGMVGPVYVYVANLVPGPAFCRVRNQFFSPAPTMELRLQQTVQDFARSDTTSMVVYVACLVDERAYRFFASGWINKPAHTLDPPPDLLGEYSKILDEVCADLPAELQAKLDDVRQELPRLFQSSYPMVLQHDDLLENNFHVDEATGHITGIIDWADAKIAPFGVSLAGMEIVLGIQTRTNWHFHPNHHSLRELFWKTFYQVAGHISKDDRRSIEVARLFGFFREYGSEEKEHAIAYLSALCLL